MDVQNDVSKYLQVTDRFFYNCYGKVAKVVGLTVESIGPEAKLGDLCRIVVEKDAGLRSEEHTSELQSPRRPELVCRLLLEIGRASCRERV